MHYFALSLVLVILHSIESVGVCMHVCVCVCIGKHYLPRGSLEVRRCSLQRSPTMHSEQDCGGQLQATRDKMNIDLISYSIMAQYCSLIFFVLLM